MYPESTMRRTSDRSRWNVTRVYERRVSPDHRYCGARAARTGHSLLEKPRPDGAQWGPGDGHTVSELQWRDALCMTCSEAGGNSAINCKAVTVIQSLIEMWFALCQGDGCEIRQANNHGMGVSIKVIHSLRGSRDVIMLKRWIQRMLIQSYVTGSSTHWQKKFNEAENL